MENTVQPTPKSDSARTADMDTLSSDQNFRVMIAEDEPLIAQDIARLMRNSGAIVIGPFGKASDALTALESEKPDLAFVDAHLTDGPAFGLADQLNGMSIPLIFLTADPEAFQMRDYPNQIIEKPFSSTTIEAELKAHRSNKNPRKTAA